MGAVGTEIKVPTVENPELTDDVPLKPGVGQNITMHALPTAWNFFPVLISAFPVHSPSFYFRSSPSLYSHKWFKQVPMGSAYGYPNVWLCIDK